jgi:DNA-binding CsgD family transcriptional regulator
MLRSFLRTYLNITENEQDLRDVQRKLENMEEGIQEVERKLENLEDKTEAQEELEEEVQNLKQSFYDSRPLTSDLSETERELLEILLNSEEWLDKSDISAKMDISKNYTGTLLVNISDKIDLQTKKVGTNNKKAYKLPEEAQKRINKGR